MTGFEVYGELANFPSIVSQWWVHKMQVEWLGFMVEWVATDRLMRVVME